MSSNESAMLSLDLQPAHRRLLLEILAEYAPDAEVWAYGSRVNGRSHGGSDLDLVVRDSSAVGVQFKGLALLRDALEESDLPILVDVLDWARVPDDMRREIERDHVVLRSPDDAIVLSE